MTVAAVAFLRATLATRHRRSRRATRLVISASAVALIATALSGPAAAQSPVEQGSAQYGLDFHGPGRDGQIVFSQQTGTLGSSVFISQPDGSAVHQVPLVYPAEDWAIPRWSPNHRQLVISHVFRFDASGNLLPFRPVTVNPDGTHFRLLETPNAPFDGGCFGGWYQDGKHLLCSYGDEEAGVFGIRAVDGGHPVRLTRYPFPAECNACDEPTDVSPDGKSFVFVRYRDENTDHQQVALFVEGLDGKNLRQLTPYGLAAAHEIASARWSPDGRSIISSTPDGQLFVVRVHGGRVRLITLQTGAAHYFAFMPDWSPDGSRIVFSLAINEQEDLYTARVDGSDVRQITNTPAFEYGPDWR